MAAVPTFCIDCGKPSKRTRCRYHQRIWEQNRSANRKAYSDPVYRSYVKDDKCAKCGKRVDLTKDHRISLEDGGTNDASNLRTLCRSCNSRKRDKSEG